MTKRSIWEVSTPRRKPALVVPQPAENRTGLQNKDRYTDKILLSMILDYSLNSNSLLIFECLLGKKVFLIQPVLEELHCFGAFSVFVEATTASCQITKNQLWCTLSIQLGGFSTYCTKYLPNPTPKNPKHFDTP